MASQLEENAYTLKIHNDCVSKESEIISYWCYVNECGKPMRVTYDVKNVYYF